MPAYYVSGPSRMGPANLPTANRPAFSRSFHVVAIKMSYAFDKQALLAQGVLPRGPSIPGQRLSNDIHPLFRREAFEMNPEWLEKVFLPGTVADDIIAQKRQHIDNSLYTRLEPALQLATHFLDISLEFISRLAFAPKGKTHLGVFDDVSEVATARREEETRALLNELAGDLLIFLNGETYQFAQGLHGLTIAYERRGFLRYQTHIRLSDGFTAVFQYPGYSSLPGAVQDAIWFSFAVTLVHEVMHAVWVYRHRFTRQGREIPRFSRDGKLNMPWVAHEPEVLPMGENENEDAEYGHAWERWMFGGKVANLEEGNGDWNPESGFCWVPKWSDFAIYYQAIVDEAEPDIFGVDINSISRMFHTETWANDKKPEISLTTERAVIGVIEQQGVSEQPRASKLKWLPSKISLEDLQSLKALIEPAPALPENFWRSVSPMELATIWKVFRCHLSPTNAEELVAYYRWKQARLQRGTSVPNKPVEAFETFRREQRVLGGNVGSRWAQ